MSTPPVSTLLDEFVGLTRRKKALEADVAEIKRELGPVTAALLDEYATEGVRRKVTTDGVAVGITRRIWARAADGDKDSAADALEAAGLGDYVQRGFNANSLSAYFREEVKRREADGDPVTDLSDLLPDTLRDVIALTDDHQLTVRF